MHKQSSASFFTKNKRKNWEKIYTYEGPIYREKLETEMALEDQKINNKWTLKIHIIHK